jgi:hypothetical protein
MLTDMEETREMRKKREKQLGLLSNENAALKQQVAKLEKVVTTLSVHEADVQGGGGDDDDDDDDDDNDEGGGKQQQQHHQAAKAGRARHGEAEELLLLLKNEDQMSTSTRRMIKLAQGQSLLEGRVRALWGSLQESYANTASFCPHQCPISHGASLPLSYKGTAR